MSSAAAQAPVQWFHHIEFFVSNALQASFWHCFHFDFHRFAQRQTEKSAEIAIRKGRIIFVFKCSTSPDDPEGIGAEVGKRGDFVKDVAFEVDHLDDVIATLRLDGLELLASKRRITDQNGCLSVAKISGSAGSIVHTLIQNIDYRGLFMPGFHPIADFSFTGTLLPSIPLLCLDHVVEAHPEQTLGNAVDWYQRTLQMRRFWSIDDKTVHTEYSALRALLVGNGGASGSVKMVLVEPATVDGTQRRNGQIEDFLLFHGSSGIQHIAFLTENIVDSVRSLRERGVEFLDIPDSYYEMLEKRLVGSKFRDQIDKDLKEIRRMKILMDFDEHGYLLQIFTKPIQDRMTFFLEVIQRQNFDGFGAGNFRALFAAVEMEQKRREEEKLEQKHAEGRS